MKHLGTLLLTLLPTLAFAQPRAGADWTNYTETGCIGGKTCTERRLQVSLQDRPVVAVRFKAHDQIGERAGGVLRVKIDGNTIRDNIDIPRAGEVFTIDVDELTGRLLIFEPATSDEVEVSQIAVLYSRESNVRRIPRNRDDRTPGRGGSGAGWRAYPSAKGCIGGAECRKNGTRATIALEDLPVIGVRFHAHDNIGPKAGGELRVRIDNTNIGWKIDIKRAGQRHDVEVDNLRGTRFVIETATDDEVELSDVEVLYGRRNSGTGNDLPRELTHEGDCIGGTDCGGRRNRIRIPLRGYPVASIRFYARDDIGPKAGGELRIRIDDEILRDYLDIPRVGQTFTIDGKGIAGEYLIIEPAEDDEVMVKDIRITFGEEDQ